MVEYFISIFSNVAVALVPLIPCVLGVWVVIDLVSGLLFKE